MRYGKHKREAAAYAQELTRENERVWRRSLGPDREAAGQLPAFGSLPPWKEGALPPWVASWVRDGTGVSAAFRTARAIPNQLGQTQFELSHDYWLAYLRGLEGDPRQALKSAMAAARRRARSAV
jgi:hypothetical protein